MWDQTIVKGVHEHEAAAKEQLEMTGTSLRLALPWHKGTMTNLAVYQPLQIGLKITIYSVSEGVPVFTIS